jgi:hypothetical protein
MATRSSVSIAIGLDSAAEDHYIEAIVASISPRREGGAAGAAQTFKLGVPAGRPPFCGQTAEIDARREHADASA